MLSEMFEKKVSLKKFCIMSDGKEIKQMCEFRRFQGVFSGAKNS